MFLKSLGFNASLNNEEVVTAIDYKITTRMGKDFLVDFQYSQNFQKYGDIRMDFISAYTNSCIVEKVKEQIKENRLKFNDKKNLSDTFGSSFFAINLSDLIKSDVENISFFNSSLLKNSFSKGLKD